MRPALPFQESMRAHEGGVGLRVWRSHPAASAKARCLELLPHRRRPRVVNALNAGRFSILKRYIEAAVRSGLGGLGPRRGLAYYIDCQCSLNDRHKDSVSGSKAYCSAVRFLSGISTWTGIPARKAKDRPRTSWISRIWLGGTVISAE